MPVVLVFIIFMYSCTAIVRNNVAKIDGVPSHRVAEQHIRIIRKKKRMC